MATLAATTTEYAAKTKTDATVSLNKASQQQHERPAGHLGDCD